MKVNIFVLILNFNLISSSVTLNISTFYKNRGLDKNHHFSSVHFHNHLRYQRNEERTVCDTCRINLYDTPFYCSIKPSLPQCIFPTCPKICDDVGGDPNFQLLPHPPTPQKRRSYPHPPYLPKIPDNLVDAFTLYPKPHAAKGIRAGPTVSFEMKHTMKMNSTQEQFRLYNSSTCELPSTNLRRIHPSSKYIEYRPTNLSYQISDVHKVASKYGLVLADFRNPIEWFSVEKSSVLETVSMYRMTLDQPQRFYVVGLSDDNEEEAGKFQYKSDNSKPTFAVFDPRIYGRVDEKCSVLSHVMGSDKRHYLTSRFWNCNKYMGDGKRLVYGLFMFPPGSMCHTRSEEECAMLKQIRNGGDAIFHNTIQIGQTMSRFIYFYSDQRSWDDAFALCKAKGLQMLDFDIKWSDAYRVVEVLEHFLLEAKLSPVTTFWTSGRFGEAFSDDRFTWTTTNTVFENHYKDEAPPFAFSWWDSNVVSSYEDASIISRRSNMKRPCVAVALNPENGGERPKLNFKPWYCDFPMYVICYKEVNGTDTLSNPIPEATTARRHVPRLESCEKLPSSDANRKSPSNLELVAHPTLIKEKIDPFDEDTCASKSKTVKRLTPNSKFVDYQPSLSFHTVEQIKEQCKRYGLLPAEIRTKEDWDAVKTAGIIEGTNSEDEASSSEHIYIIGMDDSKVPGKFQYDSGGDITFSMFSSAGTGEITDQCSMLKSEQIPGSTTRELMMHHVNCKEIFSSMEKVAYGLCMFPPTWKCLRESSEETKAAADTNKFSTIIPLGTTEFRSIFFNPVQRRREDALEFSLAANLSLLDFDSKWDDVIQVMNIVNDKLVEDGGLSQLTPFWTSGKLWGLYQNEKGEWESTGALLNFEKEGSNFEWLHLMHSNKSAIREGTIQDACIEATFGNINSVVRLRPHYCDMPKYFLMYRTNKRRRDPIGINHLGITVIETAPKHTEPNRLLKRPTTMLRSLAHKKAILKRNGFGEYKSSDQNKRETQKQSDEENEFLDSTGETHDTFEYLSEELIIPSSSSSEEIQTDDANISSTIDEVATNEVDFSIKEFNRDLIFSGKKGVVNDDTLQDNQTAIVSTAPPAQINAANSSEYYYYYYYGSSSSSDSKEEI